MLRLNSSLEHESQTLWTLFKRNDKARRLVFTSGGVPQQSPPGLRLGEPPEALRTLAGERPAEGRAATTRLALSPPTVPKPECTTQVAVLCGTDSLRSETADVNGEQTE